MPLGYLGAVPVQAHGGGVVFEIVFEPAVGGVPDGGRQRERGLPRVRVPGLLQQGGQVDLLAVAFELPSVNMSRRSPGRRSRSWTR